MKTDLFHMADLFCGAGGTSTGAIEALEALGYRTKLTAVNHWPVAVATHTFNHPDARHFCASLDSLNPRELFPGPGLDLLWASPECTHHSVARGGKPINDQSRATAWCVTRWAEALQPGVILIENVPEFQTWGPCGSDGRPLASRKGDTFRAWLASLEAVGYKVDYRVLCAADYGDPTTRRRLFVQAVRGRRKITWPDATHRPTPDLFGDTQPWRTANDCIDWTLTGESIFDRKRPLQPRTMERIEAGLKKFGGEPFLAILRGTGSVRSIQKPAPTVTAGGLHLGLCEPFILGQQSGSVPRSVNDPLPTVSTAGAIALVQPFLCSYYGSSTTPTPTSSPVPTVTTKDRFALVMPNESNMDIRFRMLQPHELAAAQGFRPNYKFAGTKTEQVKQIGNAVPRNLARALVLAAVGQDSKISKHSEAA